MKQLFAEYDWEEPFPLNSLWLQRRRALIARVRAYFQGVSATSDRADFFTFVFSFVLFNAGSDAW